MLSKRCPKCGEEKPVSEFYKHRSRPDGLQAICKSCIGIANEAWAKRNPRGATAYSRKWRLKNPESARISSRRWRLENPKKIQAHTVFNRAVESGKIRRPLVCIICDATENIDAHHPNYDHPLEATGLCRRCHIRHHKVITRAKRMMEESYAVSQR